MTLVDSARVHYPRSVVSAHTAYYAVEFSRGRNSTQSIDLDSAFIALQPLSYLDAAPTERDWDFASLNAAFAAEQNAGSAASLSTPSSPASRRRITPVPVPSWRGVDHVSPGRSLSTASPNPVTPTLPMSRSPSGARPSTPPVRRVSFQDLGYRYRVGDKRQLEESLAGDDDHHPGGGTDDADDIGDYDSDEEEYDDEEDDMGDEDIAARGCRAQGRDPQA